MTSGRPGGQNGGQNGGLPGSTGLLLEHLRRRGHDTVLIRPLSRNSLSRNSLSRNSLAGNPLPGNSGSRNGTLPGSVAGAPIVPVPSSSLLGHPVGLPYREVMRALGAFAPDVVHLDATLPGGAAAGLGAAVLGAAAQLGVPTLAVEDAPGGLAGRPGLTGIGMGIGDRLRRRLFGRADLTLRPPAVEFGPHRGPESARLRRAWAPGAEIVVGYWDVLPVAVVGTVAVRLGAPSALEDAGRPGVVAALDLLVVGPALVNETVDERALVVERALASGVPVIAPADGQELVRAGLDGLTYRNAVELERCVADLAGDAHRRHWAGMAATSGAQRRARERFGDELIARYRDLIAAGPGFGVNLRSTRDR